MPTSRSADRNKLPGRFEHLVRLRPPQAITDDSQYEKTVAMIDRLMAVARLTRGQSLYLETLVQLVQAYEAEHHAIDVSDISGLDALKHLLDEYEMGPSDLARLLGVHASMGSKILKGERALTVDHLRKLARHFNLGPSLFMD